MKLSTVILTKNEEKNIREAIESVLFSDEIIVIDDASADQTAKIAERLGAKVFRRALNGDFSSQRNFGLSKAKGEWVLFIDADERVKNRLKNEIIQAINDPLRKTSAYFLRREDVFLGKTLNHGEVGGAKFVRLARKNAGKWTRRVHEVWEMNGDVGVLKNPVLHYPHATLKEFISDLNFNSTLHAQANLKEKKKSNLLKILLWRKLKFFQDYFIKKGFLDGTHGFVLAFLMSFHSFLSWSKQWLLQTRLPAPKRGDSGQEDLA